VVAEVAVEVVEVAVEVDAGVAVEVAEVAAEVAVEVWALYASLVRCPPKMWARHHRACSFCGSLVASEPLSREIERRLERFRSDGNNWAKRKISENIHSLTE